MSDLIEAESPVFELIELVLNDGGYKIGKLPEDVAHDIILEPSLTLDFMDCLTDCAYSVANRPPIPFLTAHPFHF